MAILSQGILGEVVGKTGPVVSYMRFGQNITRSKGSTRKNRIETPARKMQREKIKVCNDFTQAFSGTGFFNKTFPAYGHTGSGYNRVTSSIMNLAIVTNPVVAIAWPKVLVSKGPVAPVDYASALVNDENNIAFTWTDNSGDGTAKKNDRAILVAWFSESKQAVFAFSDAERKDGTALLETGSIKGTAHTWLGFLSADETNAANSVYSGELTI
ncbi:MAG TPA: hypothetical protein DIT07_16715 [Sphingobacteriaceae bacterium]|nr:hypothetical protein [Sphingobacteriaceae bacterium]